MTKSMQRFALSTLPRERWRNGAGWTRAVQQQGEGDEMLWRVSLAEISQAAPFSQFKGLDRTTVLVKGGPVRLSTQPGEAHAHKCDEHWALLDLGDMASYPGELALANDQPGTEALLWNVMVRRDRAHVTVCLHRHGPLILPAEGHSLVWVIRGALSLSDAALSEHEHEHDQSQARIGPDEGLSWRRPNGHADEPPCLHLVGPDALLLYTHVMC